MVPSRKLNEGFADAPFGAVDLETRWGVALSSPDICLVPRVEYDKCVELVGERIVLV